MSMDDRPPAPRYRAADLIAFARALFAAAGCDGDKPQAIAELLVEADLMGHTTHGLQLCAPYLGEIESGAMKPKGEPTIVADRGPVVTWDGGTLPGVWLPSSARRSTVSAPSPSAAAITSPASPPSSRARPITA